MGYVVVLVLILLALVLIYILDKQARHINLRRGYNKLCGRVTTLPRVTHSAITNSRDFRSYNSSALLLADKVLYSHKVTNFTQCVGCANIGQEYYDTNRHALIESYLVLSSGNKTCSVILDMGANNRCMRGYEDARLFQWRDSIWMICNYKHKKCFARMALVRLLDIGEQLPTILQPKEIRHIDYDTEDHEKNWTPLVDSKSNLWLIYKLEPLTMLDINGNIVSTSTSGNSSLEMLRGGSNLINIDGKYIGIAHRRYGAIYYSSVYSIEYSGVWQLIGVSPLFVLGDMEPCIQFVAGMYLAGNNVYITYGEQDCYSKELVVGTSTLLSMLQTPSNVWIP